MDKNLYGRTATFNPALEGADVDEGLRQHMLRVYNFMMIGLVVTGLVAYFTSTSHDLMMVLFATPLKWVVMLAPFAFILVLSFGINKMSASTVQMVFWAYCATMGLSLATIFVVFTGTSIARVFFITSGMFAAMSLWGYTTKRDLTGFGSFLMMGLFGIMIAGIANIFIGSSALQFAVSVIGVLVFTGLTAYDTQNIKEVYCEGQGHEATMKFAVMGALTLYLDFINIFVMLLQLMGDRE
ncbi:MAG: Bax inhibitor-1/YccA family protein [Rhodospirillaceae bacterium]